MDAERLEAALDRHAARWGDVVVTGSTGSTNADAATAAIAGAGEGWTVLADEQLSGRGRLQRSWSSPPGGSLSMSVVLRPTVAASRWGWLPLLVGTAAVEALTPHCPIVLKWPNDLVIEGPARDGGPGPRKLGGILMERVPAGTDAVVVGLGLNVALSAAQLPTPEATSLVLEAADGDPAALPDREDLAALLLASIRYRYDAWQESGGDAGGSGLRDAYVGVCSTVGSRVSLRLPDGREVAGDATGVDAEGRLVVETEGRPVAYAAGDVVHLRR
jgi:BirA family transcriptional regulator, biotin operon repressor / biotin---[acetyl-CoA-carboxylase] ligase